MVGEESFDIRCALDEKLAHPGAPIRGWVTRVTELVSWGGYFRLLDPSLDAVKREVEQVLLDAGVVQRAHPGAGEDLMQQRDAGWMDLPGVVVERVCEPQQPIATGPHPSVDHADARRWRVLLAFCDRNDLAKPAA